MIKILSQLPTNNQYHYFIVSIIDTYTKKMIHFSSMELRILNYFLAVADEGSFSRAAERLHVSQPALSQQLASYENEIGAKLFNRTSRHLELTEKGRLLLGRARDIIELATRTEASLKSTDTNELSGTLVIGAGEVTAFGRLAVAMTALREKHPHLTFRIISGNGEDLAGGLANGTIDLALFVGPGRYEEFDYQELPDSHRWGLLLKADDSLARKKAITPKDLPKTSVITSRQRMVMNFLSGWLGQPFSNLNIAATYNLLYNAAHLVSEGLGAAICLDGLLPAIFSDKLVFRPFSPVLTSDAYLAWKRGTTPSPAARALIDLMGDS